MNRKLSATLTVALLGLAAAVGPAAASDAPFDARTALREVLEDAGEARQGIMQALRDLGPEKALLSSRLLWQAKARYFVEVEAEVFVKRPDHRNMTREILCDTVNLSVEAREKWPWARELSQADFETYVVPYRHTAERLTNWRRDFCTEESLLRLAEGFAKRYDAAETREAKSAVFKELVHHLNSRWLASRVKYAPRGQPALAPGELLENGTGRCTDLTCGIVCLCRAFGIAATGIRAIWWPKSDGNHCWAGVKDPVTGEWYDFDSGLSAELSEGYFRAFRHRKPFAKIYRITPGEERGAVAAAAAAREGERIDPFIDLYLVCRPMVDLTAEYGPVLSREFETLLRPDAPVYACVFNHGTWMPVAISRTDSAGKVLFRDLGADGVLWLVAPAGKSGAPDLTATLGLSAAHGENWIEAKDPRGLEEAPEIELTAPAFKDFHGASVLACVKGRWIPSGTAQVEDRTARLKAAPGVVYLLRAPSLPSRPKITRPFMVSEKGEVTWY